jgi:diacylglycerol kinase family enzyme
MVEPEREPASAASARWLARLTLLLALAAIVVLLIGGITSLGVLAVAVVGLAVQLAAVWLFLSRRGLSRVLAGIVAVGVPVAVIVIYVAQRLIGEILGFVVLAIAAVVTGRAALARLPRLPGMPEKPASRPRRPFVIMNPRSGGGKVGKFHLEPRACDLGATVALIEGPGPVDVAAMARAAVTDGADLLGVAGGDGTQALVAGIAADCGLPFLVISAGTRNHFAMDLGLDRDHPDQGLEALNDGVELVLDLGVVGGRTFVNNASFGAYAEIVQSPEYRDDKRGTTLRMLPDLLTQREGPRLSVRIDDELTLDGPQAVLISNNPYELADPAGLGRRARIDLGVLGVIAISVENAAQAAALLRGRRSSGLRTMTAHEVVIDSTADQIPVGIDGESVLLPAPVRCQIRPGALRVRVPRERLGPPMLAPGRALDVLRHQAFSSGRPTEFAPGTRRPS